MSQTAERTRVTMLLTVFAVALSTCDSSAPDAGNTSAPATAATPAPLIRDVPAATLSPAPTPMPLFGGPEALGADARAGVISGGELAGWIYDGRTGTLKKDGSLPPASVSPSGRWTLDSRNVMNGRIIERTDLWLLDNINGSERLLYSPPELPPQYPGKGVQPNLNVPPYVFQRTEYPLTWSPDETYITMAQVQVVSASADADGRPLVVIEIATGNVTELGYALYGYAGVWRAPHTLAYVKGAGRESWQGKTLIVWSPESGMRALTDPFEVGLAPSWGPDGRLWFAAGPSGQYDVPTFFSGRGIGDRSVYALDVATGFRTRLPRVAGYADEGARASDDGRVVLINRRRLDPTPGPGTKNSWLELWIANVDGSDARPLVKMSAVNGFGYYGGYGSLAKLEWVR